MDNRKTFRWGGYSVEDCRCIYCLHHRGKKAGCALLFCACEKERREALRAGRIKAVWK